MRDHSHKFVSLSAFCAQVEITVLTSPTPQRLKLKYIFAKALTYTLNLIAAPVHVMFRAMFFHLMSMRRERLELLHLELINKYLRKRFHLYFCRLKWKVFVVKISVNGILIFHKSKFTLFCIFAQAAVTITEKIKFLRDYFLLKHFYLF